MQTSYDIIGDIHGQLPALKALLGKLGYEPGGAAFLPPQGRKLVSVGDMINKGPAPLECLELFQAMIRNGDGLAIIGNHEINAVHYLENLRPRTEGTTAQFQPTLSHIEADPARWQVLRDFILELPTRLELADGALRIVHAHWPDDSFPRVIDESLLAQTGMDGDWGDALQEMVKGPEGDSEPFVDKKGVTRTRDRVQWWRDYPADAPFIAFGHYCFPWSHTDETPDSPTLLGPGQNAACLDFGAGIGDRLVALRWPELEFVEVTIA